MAVSTADFTVTNSAWTELSDGSSQVLVQKKSQGIVLIHAGTSSPGSSVVGIRLDDGNPIFSGTGMAAGDKVYGRSGTIQDELVTVMKL